jgi:hypothetical protein
MKDIVAAAAHSLEKYGEPGGALPATIDFLCSHDLLELADGGVFGVSHRAIFRYD